MTQTKSLDPILHESVTAFLANPHGEMAFNCNQANWRLSLSADRTILDASIAMEIPCSLHDFIAWKFWWDLEPGYQNHDVQFDVCSHEISVNWSIEDFENDDSVISLLTAMQKKVQNAYSLIASKTNPSVSLLRSLRTKIHENINSALDRLSTENTTNERMTNSALGVFGPNSTDGTVPEELLDRMTSLLRIAPASNQLVKSLSRLLQSESIIAKELIDNGNLPETEKADLQNLQNRHKFFIDTHFFGSRKPMSVAGQVKAPETSDSPSQSNQATYFTDNASIGQPTPTAKSIFDALCGEIIGQEEACRILASVGHCLIRGQRIGAVLMTGPTGVGKSLILAALARSIGNVHVEHVSATSLVPEGITGTSLSDVLRAFLPPKSNQKEHPEVTPAPLGILVIDEFDKISRRDNDFLEYARTIQNSLLRVIDGSDYILGETKQNSRISTKNIIVVLAGSWQESRDEKIQYNAMGFLRENAHANMAIEVTDLGISKEMRGRFSRVVSMRALSDSDFLRILAHPTLSPWKILEAALPGIPVIIDPEVNALFARKAYTEGYGARWLQRPIIALTDRLLYAESTESICVTKELALDILANIN